MRGSSRNSIPAALGQVGDPSRPSSSACHVSSGVFMSPGKRVARPTIAMSSLSTSRDQSKSSAVSSTSGSPSTMTVASDSMVGWRNATVAVSVTPVRSSMSLAIATASREDRPSSTIGVESSIASADWPVALATQLRSHSRISATVISVRAGVAGRSGASLKPSSDVAAGAAPASDVAAGCGSGVRCRRRCGSGVRCRRRCGSGVDVASASGVSGEVFCESGSVSAIFKFSQFRRGRRWPPSRCAGCRPGRRRGRRGGRSCRWRCAGSHLPGSAARRAR